VAEESPPAEREPKCGDIEQMPDELAARVRELLEAGEEIRVAVWGDLTLTGDFGNQWLVATERRLLSLPQNEGGGDGVVEVPLAEAIETHERGVSGGKLLEVYTKERAIPLLRYTTARNETMSEALPAVKRLVTEQGGPKEQPPPRGRREPRQVCEKCGKPIPRWSGSCLECLDRRGLILRMICQIKPHWAMAALAFALMLLITALEMAPPYLQKVMIDDVIAPRNFRLLWQMVYLIVGIFLVVAALSIVRGQIMAWLGNRVVYDLRVDLYNHLQKLSIGFYDSKQTGWIMDRVTNDTGNLQRFLAEGLQDASRDALSLVTIAVILFVMNWKLALLTLLPTPLLVLLTAWFMQRMHTLFHRAWRRRTLVASLLGDVIPGVRVVRAFAQERREEERFNERTAAARDAFILAQRTMARFFPTIGLLTAAGFVVVWAYGGYQVMMATKGMTLGVLVAFIGFLWRFYGPLQNMARLSHMLQHAATSAQRIFEVLDTEPEVGSRPDAMETPELEGAVEFKDVTFGYEPGQIVLQNLNFKVKPGEMIGLVGPSGAGKSTTINLLCRFYDVNEGAIEVDGHDLRDLDLASYRRQLGVVLQDPYLFSGTIAENIAYGNPDATHEEIIRAAKIANAHQFIVKLPDAYDTVVGERGARLSAGERQRVSIARAVLRDPKILILDEATSSVDTETEALIREAIDRLVANRTTFAIAHRLSTLSAADRLIVLDEGKIVEIGTHRELLAKTDGVFKNLVQMQMELSSIVAVGG